MDRDTARKFYEIVTARAGVRGKDVDKWTKDEELRVGIQFDRMPGEYREFARLDWGRKNKSNRDTAKRLGMDVDAFGRISHVGGAAIMCKAGEPESALAEPNPGIPGNTHGIEIVEMYVTPS